MTMLRRPGSAKFFEAARGEQRQPLETQSDSTLRCFPEMLFHLQLFRRSWQ